MWLATVTLLTVWWKMLSLGSRLQEPLAFILVSVPGCVLEPFVRKFPGVGREAGPDPAPCGP